jgi:hypothetical protein
MAAREATLRFELRLPATLIERTISETTSTTTKKPSNTTQKPSSRPTPKLSSRPTKDSSSRPKAALHAAAVERPPHFARATLPTRSKRGDR